MGSLYRVLPRPSIWRSCAIDAESLTDAAHYLQACIAFNAKDDAVSTDFNPLTR